MNLRILYYAPAAALLAWAGLPAVHSGERSGPSVKIAPSVSYAAPTYAALTDSELLPNVLSRQDIGLYEAIFDAQKQANWSGADAAIAELDNDLLMGHVLAERYLSRQYKTSADELAAWLDAYGDHPEADDIYALALIKAPALKKELAPVRKQSTLGGYGDDIGLANQEASQDWLRGLTAWRFGHTKEAASIFSALAGQKETSRWKATAAAYWAYRSYHAMGDKASAGKYLRLAASHPRSFYGILARKHLKQELELDARPVELTVSDVLEMIGEPPVRRAIALAQGGFAERAEKELRALFPLAEDDEKMRLLALARELGLASVQISMARQLADGDNALDFARYPVPTWQPDGGYTVDPLLMFSLMRQESGFRPSAVSPSGALGLMQLMPQTAALMKKRLSPDAHDRILANTIEPIMNVTLGQSYVEHLLTNPLVEGNLIYMLAAYNAGPGRLQQWKAGLDHNNDPLLFIESIPIAQTRYYVQQVMTNYWIYSELVGASHHSVYALTHGRWPHYDDKSGGVASRSALAGPGA